MRGLKNAQALPAILEILKLSDNRAALPDREKEIDNFQTVLSQLMTIYQNSLLIATNTEQRIRAEYEDRIVASETAIKSLKEKAESAKTEMETAKAEFVSSKARVQELLNDIAQKDNTIAEKDAALSDKTKLITEQEKRITHITEQINRAQEATEHFDEIQNELNAAKVELVHLQNDFMMFKAKAQNDQINAVLKEREKAQAKVEAIIAKYANRPAFNGSQSHKLPKPKQKKPKQHKSRAHLTVARRNK